jgi:hypothetical protein
MQIASELGIGAYGYQIVEGVDNPIAVVSKELKVPGSRCVRNIRIHLEWTATSQLSDFSIQSCGGPRHSCSGIWILSQTVHSFTLQSGQTFLETNKHLWLSCTQTHSLGGHLVVETYHKMNSQSTLCRTWTAADLLSSLSTCRTASIMALVRYLLHYLQDSQLSFYWLW